MSDDESESTPPVNSFGAARATARELAAVKRAVAGVHRLAIVGLLLLAFVIGCIVFLAVVVAVRLHR